MQISISGSRTITDYSIVKKWFDLIFECLPEVQKTKHGGAEGLDKLADKYLREEKGIISEVLRPQYKYYPEHLKRFAPKDRNWSILDGTDCLISMTSGEGNVWKGGTIDAIQKALYLTIPVFLC